MNAQNQPISEQFRIVAKQWVDADTAARMLEETKTAVLSQMIKDLGDMPYAHAERDVKASKEWLNHIEKMVDARGRANLLKVKLEFIRMRFQEQSSFEATQRAERRL